MANAVGTYSYIGKGIAQPLQLVKGSVQYQIAKALVEQSMLIILNTPIGTKYMFPEWGSRCRELLFEPNDTVLQAAMRHFAAEAIGKWEKRVRYLGMTFTQGDNGVINCEVGYMILGSNQPDSFVYPFARKTKY